MPGSSSLRNVRFESTDESTASASMTSPLSSVTPVVRPPFTSMRATGASVRISTPSESAALAIAFDTPPVPPLGMPHARNAPSISPM